MAKDYTRKVSAKALAASERLIGEQVQLGHNVYEVVRIIPSSQHPDNPETATVYLMRIGPLE